MKKIAILAMLTMLANTGCQVRRHDYPLSIQVIGGPVSIDVDSVREDKNGRCLDYWQAGAHHRVCAGFLINPN